MCFAVIKIKRKTSEEKIFIHALSKIIQKKKIKVFLIKTNIVR